MSSSTPVPTIRPARTTDPAEVDRLYEICLRTGADGADGTTLTEHPRLVGDVYLGQYLAFEPDLAFVLVAQEDGREEVVGYVIGARDSAAFHDLLVERWWPDVRERYPASGASTPFDADLIETLHGDEQPPEVLDRYPAHLHIDLLPVAQGGGHGYRLLTALFGALRDLGVPGVHLDVSARNPRAVRFYERVGFEVLVPHADGSLLGFTLQP